MALNPDRLSKTTLDVQQGAKKTPDGMWDLLVASSLSDPHPTILTSPQKEA